MSKSTKDKKGRPTTASHAVAATSRARTAASPAVGRKARVAEPPGQKKRERSISFAPPGARDGSSSGETLGKYVYCIVEASEPLRFGGIGISAEPADVYTITHGKLAAVVSDAPIGIYDPTRENVLAHERVNETVMRRHTVIPMSFGTVFRTRDDVVALLRSAADAFHDVLGKMRDKLEFGLKVLWDREAVLREIEKEDEGLRRLKSEISSQKGSTYFARVQYGRMIEAALEARSERYVSDVFGALRDVSVASRANKPIGDKMIMNAAFLVARDRETAFDAAVKAIATRYPALTFKYTGPWPPYNFVNIRLKLERSKAQ